MEADISAQSTNPTPTMSHHNIHTIPYHDIPTIPYHNIPELSHLPEFPEDQSELRLPEAGDASGDWLWQDRLEGSGGSYQGDSDDFSYLFSSVEPEPTNTIKGMRDIYVGEDANTRMNHLMHSDTMIVIIALISMIVLALIFRSLCMRLTSQNRRKEQMRGGLKALADHMNVVTRSMSNELEQEHSAARAVMRTYSNYGRMKPPTTNGDEHSDKPVSSLQSRDSLRVQAFSNSMTKETHLKPGQVTIDIEMTEPQERKR